MTVVAPGSSFTVKFIPKHCAAELGTLTLYNKNTGVESTPTVTYYEGDYYVEADITHTAAEGEFYKYSVYDDQGTLSYVGGVFVTAQSDYSINNGGYTQNTTANEYITR